MENLIKHISKTTKTSPELEQAIKTVFKEEQVEKHKLLLKEKSYVRKLYFINKGILRTYYIHDEKEVTSWFYPENQFLTSWYSFYKQETSYEYIEALEDCSVLNITTTKN